MADQVFQYFLFSILDKGVVALFISYPFNRRRDTMSDPPGTAGDTYGLMEGPLTSDPREKKKHFILDEIDTHLDHLEQEEKHSLWQNFWFFVMVHT